MLVPLLESFGESILVEAGLLQVDVGQADHGLDLLACALGQLVDKHRLDEVHQIRVRPVMPSLPSLGEQNFQAGGIKDAIAPQLLLAG